MIAFLRGSVAGRTAQALLLDVQGVGYEVLMPEASLARVGAAQGEVCIFTHLQVSDAGVALYGFMSTEEKALFERLIAVNGVGPKMALAALSTFEPQALVDAVMAQDIALISKIPGVGKKTASRMVLELKGSFEQGFESLFAAGGAVASSDNEALRLAADDLLALGFTSTEAELALRGAPADAAENQLVQYALRKLGADKAK